MPVEPQINSIFDLNAAWPTAADPKSDGDDHLRNLKLLLKITFPAFKGPMPIAHDQLVSKQLLYDTAFSTVLPGQPNDGLSYGLASVSGSASWKRDDIFSNATRLAQSLALQLF